MGKSWECSSRRLVKNAARTRRSTWSVKAQRALRHQRVTLKRAQGKTHRGYVLCNRPAAPACGVCFSCVRVTSKSMCERVVMLGTRAGFSLCLHTGNTTRPTHTNTPAYAAACVSWRTHETNGDTLFPLLPLVCPRRNTCPRYTCVLLIPTVPASWCVILQDCPLFAKLVGPGQCLRCLLRGWAHVCKPVSLHGHRIADLSHGVVLLDVQQASQMLLPYAFCSSCFAQRVHAVCLTGGDAKVFCR